MAAGGALEQVDLVGPGQPGRVRHAVPELERALEQRRALAEGLDVHRGHARADGGAQRRRLIAGGQVVVGDRRGALGAGLRAIGSGQRGRERPVQLGALARQQVVVDRLGHQRVAQRVALAVEHDDVRRHRLSEPVAERPPVEPADLGEQRVVEHAAGGEHADDLLRVVAEPVDPQRERGGEARRERPASVRPGGQELLGEQRVALAARVQPLDERRVGRGAEDVAELLGELVAAEPREVDPQRADPLELREQRAQRVPPVQLVRPVGRDDQQRLGRERGGEEAEERARRRVGPVQVLDHQQHGGLARQPVEHREQRLEDPRLVARAALVPADRGGEPGQQRGQLGPDVVGERVEHRVRVAHQRAQRGDQRGVGQLALAELDALAAQHARAVGGRARLELGDEPALADARLADHEGERRLPARRIGERGLELRELQRAAHDPLRGDAGGHHDGGSQSARAARPRTGGVRRRRAAAGARPPGRSAGPR